MPRRVLMLWLAGCLAFVGGVPLSTAQDPGRLVVHIAFSSQDELAQLAARLDVWEVHRAEGYLVALVDSREREWLAQAGFTFQVDTTHALQPNTIPSYPCYRTIAEQYTQFEQWAVQYPHIAQLLTIGASYEHRDLRVLRLTNSATNGDKPRFFLMANIHGRELITNETALAFIQRLLGGYGVDADFTWLLDYHQIDVLVSANPDGHVRNEPGNVPWAYWRKNTRPYGGCYGVDLNRNSAFKWGLDDYGSSAYPCDLTYRGPSPVSESETQAVQQHVRSLFPDQRGPLDNDTAPITTTGILITLHSYGDLVLWPWGWTGAPAPNSAQLQTLGQKFAAFNGYTAQQAMFLYPTNGTTDDWSYGELSIASYTFEIGSSSDGFYPSCSRYDQLVQPNVEALLYAAKVARTPYLTSFGPDATLTATLTSTVGLTWVSVQAMLTGTRPISAAEAYLDTPPWAGGTPHALTPADGHWDSTFEAARGDIGTALLPGRHTILVRGQDTGGYWGPVSAVFSEPTVWPYAVYLPLLQRQSP